jgi:hypothetical protein
VSEARTASPIRSPTWRRSWSRVVDLLEAVEVHEDDREPAAVALRVPDGLADPLAEEQPVGQAGERVVQRLVLVELALADELLLGALALGDVLDHRHHRLGGAGRVALQDGPHVGPQRRARPGGAARLELEGLARPGHHLGQEPVDDVPVVAQQMLGEARAGQLVGADPQHLLERRVDLDAHAVGVQAQDADRGAVEQGAEAGDGARLVAASLELGHPGDRRPEHHGEHLQGLAIVLIEALLLGTAHHVQGADHLVAPEQRDADQRRVAHLGALDLVDAGVADRVLDQHRLPTLDRVAGHRARDRPPRVERAGGDAADGARVDHLAVDQVDHGPVGADDRLGAVGHDLHDRLEIIAGGHDAPLGLDDQREALIAVELAARHGRGGLRPDAGRPCAGRGSRRTCSHYRRRSAELEPIGTRSRR